MEHYLLMQELLHKANLVEQQLKIKGTTMKPDFRDSSKPSYKKKKVGRVSQSHILKKK